MLTEDQLADQLRAQLRREIAAIEPRTDLVARLHRRQARRSLAARAGLAAVPAAAVAVAVTMVVSAAGGGAAPTVRRAGPVMLTAATVQRMASQSRLALARSGRVTVTYRQTENGTWQESGKDTITFAGKNWNDVISMTNPSGDGPAASRETAIDRIVDGKFYLHTEGPDGRVRWYRDTNPSGHPSVKIPDPRTLFGVLEPSARFEVVGHQVVGGVRLTELRATKPPRLTALGWLPGAGQRAHTVFLEVWVDRRHVVHRISLRTRQHRTTVPIYMEKAANGRLKFVVPSKAYLKEAWAMARKLKKSYHATAGIDPKLSAAVHHYLDATVVSVTFSAFGKPQVITAPRHSVPQYGRG